jgi:hypothetical protein
VGDVLAVGMIVGGMALCWLYAVALDRGLSSDDGPKVKP